MQGFRPIPGLTGRTFIGSSSATQQHEPQPAIKCPRCDSTDTKFCYYNNYNLSQPRHFCKSCRRYWTNGGVLRNVPVGGGCRKNSKRSSKSKPDKHHPKPATASGSSSESSSTLTVANPNPDPILEQPVFLEGFNFSDPVLLPGFRVADPEAGSGVNGLDWGSGLEDSRSLFDIDPAVHRSQSHWGDNDPSLYLP